MSIFTSILISQIYSENEDDAVRYDLYNYLCVKFLSEEPECREGEMEDELQ